MSGSTTKNFKKQVKPDKKLTDFFLRKASDSTSAPSSSQPSTKPAVAKASQSSKAGKSSKSTKSSLPQKPDSDEVISLSSGSHISISSESVQLLSSPPKRHPRTIMAAVEILSPSPHRSTKNRVTHLVDPSNGSFKHSLSPEIQFLGASQRSPKKPPMEHSQRSISVKRKKTKFDSDSETDALDTVVRVPKPALLPRPTSIVGSSNFLYTPPLKSSSGPLKSKHNIVSPSKSRRKLSPHKKARFSSPVLVASDVGELVPSSQSDERELSVARPSAKNPEEVKETVTKWQESVGAVDVTAYEANTMDIDQAQSFPDSGVPPVFSSAGGPSAVDFEAKVNVQLESSSARTSVTPVTRLSSSSLIGPITPPITPPRNDPVPLPASPMALDAESKTAQIIAQIKASAYAASTSGAEEKRAPLEYRDLEESSEDEDLDIFSARQVDKGKGKRTFTLPLSKQVSSVRYNLRTRKASITPSSSTSPPAIDLRKRGNVGSASHSMSSILTGDKGKGNAKGRKSANPLELLLREKSLADKRGKGMDALRLAEDAVAAEEDEDTRVVAYADWGDEEAAVRAVREGIRIGLKSSSPVGNRSESPSDDMIIGEKDRERLGLKDGKAITKILENDKENGKQRVKVNVLGISLWTEGEFDEEMDVGGDGLTLAISLLDDVDGHPILNMFKGALCHADATRAALLLESNMLSRDPPTLTVAVPCLCQLSVSIPENPFSEPAFRALLHMWNGHGNVEVGIPFSFVLTTIVRLGAKPAVLDAARWTIGPNVRGQKVEKSHREDVLYRFVTLLGACAGARGLSHQEVPDILLALLLLALDALSSADMRRDLTVAVDAICQSLAPGTDVVLDAEVAICAKLLAYASRLTPINKSYVVSFLSAGSTRTRRIARFLSHGLLTEAKTISQETYAALPPLSNLTELLKPPAGSNAPFDVQNRMTDYEEVGYYVDILSVALSDIDGYVAEERNAHKVEQPSLDSSIDGSPRKNGAEKVVTPLQVIMEALQDIYGKIVDTRAAHLDRSRTKAALQRLSMRIFYQRNAALKSGSGKPRNISQYFLTRN